MRAVWLVAEFQWRCSATLIEASKQIHKQGSISWLAVLSSTAVRFRNLDVPSIPSPCKQSPSFTYCLCKAGWILLASFSLAACSFGLGATTFWMGLDWAGGLSQVNPLILNRHKRTACAGIGGGLDCGGWGGSSHRRSSDVGVGRFQSCYVLVRFRKKRIVHSPVTTSTCTLAHALWYLRKVIYLLSDSIFF